MSNSVIFAGFSFGGSGPLFACRLAHGLQQEDLGDLVAGRRCIGDGPDSEDGGEMSTPPVDVSEDGRRQGGVAGKVDQKAARLPLFKG